MSEEKTEQKETTKEAQKMTVRDAAESYEPKMTKSVADLESFSTEMEIHDDGIGTDKSGKEFHYNYILIEGEEYRIPDTVLNQIKTHLEEKPDTTKFKVKKTGEGLKTRYQAVALD